MNDVTHLKFPGDLLLTNWRPISLTEICYDGEKTVSDIFNQISSVPTLKIIIRYSNRWCWVFLKYSQVCV